MARFVFFSDQGYATVDTRDFMAWFQTAAEYGSRTFYARIWCDYPPFNVYIFWFFGLLAKSLSVYGTATFTYVMKLPPNLFDMATASLIFVFVRERLDFRMALLAAGLYAFNPAVVFNAAVWGQFDAIYTFFLVLSLMLALAAKPELSAVAFFLGVLTKPQSIALLSLIAYLILKKYSARRFLTSLVAATGTVFVVILPFEWSNPVTFLSNIYLGAYGGYSYTSVNAFNMWALGGLWVPDADLFILGWILFGCLAAFTLYVLHKRFNESGELLVVFAAFLLFFGFFMLPTRIHERYLFQAISTLAIMFPFVKKARALYVVLTATLLANMVYVLYWLNAYAAAGYSYGPNLTGDPVTISVSVVNVVTFIYCLLLLWGEFKGKAWLKNSAAKISTLKEVKDNVRE